MGAAGDQIVSNDCVCFEGEGGRDSNCAYWLHGSVGLCICDWCFLA